METLTLPNSALAQAEASPPAPHGAALTDLVFQRTLQALHTKTACIAVVGLGYVGLPIAQRLAESGLSVLGFDADETKIARLQAGQSYIRHIPAEGVARLVRSGRLSPTAETERLHEADAILICVPTPLSDSRDPDLSHVVATTQQIARCLRPGQLVVLESTTYPGTTRQIVLPILEQTGWKVGEDYFLAYSPEREDPGSCPLAARDIPKVVGGIEPRSQQLAVALYEHLTRQVVPVASCEVAEACKILENTYRAVNIALVNELKVLFSRLDLDIWDVIAAAQTKPFGFQAFFPGPGLGGHCIPVDPFYLSWLARTCGVNARFIELAGEINRDMPRYVLERLAAALNDAGRALRGSRVCLLGVAYKRDVDDPRESPAFTLLEQLQAAGAELSYHDPYIPTLPRMRHYRTPTLSSSPLTEEFLSRQDALLIVTDHSALDYDWIVRHARLIVDCRNATRNVRQGREKIWRA